jgi:hypothetical protein
MNEHRSDRSYQRTIAGADSRRASTYGNFTASGPPIAPANRAVPRATTCANSERHGFVREVEGKGTGRAVVGEGAERHQPPIAISPTSWRRAHPPASF